MAGKRGPYAKTAARRQEILDVALEAYAQSDGSAVPLRQIADAAGLIRHSMSTPGLVKLFVQLAAAAAETGHSATSSSASGRSDSGPPPSRAWLRRGCPRTRQHGVHAC
jgi:hypothetical protein